MLCPTTERDLATASGGRGVVGAGAIVCLGSDSTRSSTCSRSEAVELDESLASVAVVTIPAAALLASANRGRASSLGWPDAGRLEPGALAT